MSSSKLSLRSEFDFNLVDHTKENEVYLVIIRRNLFGGEYLHVEPRINGKTLCPDGWIGGMMGGNFVYSSDSRFRQISPYPLPVHDRFETQKFYNSMD